MEAPSLESIPICYIRYGYLSEEGTPDLSKPDAVDQDKGKVNDLILNSQPFEFTNIDYPNKIVVTVTYDGDENDQFTALFIPPLDISRGEHGYLKKMHSPSVSITPEKCMLFRTSTETSDKVGRVTREILVTWERGGKLPVTTFDNRTEHEHQFIIGEMSKLDQLMLIPKLYWKNLRSWFS